MSPVTIQGWNVTEEEESFFLLYSMYVEEQEDDRMKQYLAEALFREEMRQAFTRTMNPCFAWQILCEAETRGFLICRKESDSVYLADLYVFPEDRNRGIATAAMKQWMALFPGKRIWLTPSPKAKRFYERLGFHPTGEIYMDNQTEIWERKDG